MGYATLIRRIDAQARGKKESPALQAGRRALVRPMEGGHLERETGGPLRAINLLLLRSLCLEVRRRLVLRDDGVAEDDVVEASRRAILCLPFAVDFAAHGVQAGEVVRRGRARLLVDDSWKSSSS